MSKEKLEDTIEKEINEADPRGEAVRALVNVPSNNKIHTSHEVITDLTENKVKAFSVMTVLDKFLGGNTILKDLIDTMERKLISLDRKSRLEIVEVAKNPDQTNIMPGQDTGLLKRFFTSRKQPPQ